MRMNGIYELINGVAGYQATADKKKVDAPRFCLLQKLRECGEVDLVGVQQDGERPFLFCILLL